jgi:prepilin-type N-terminal cleavage/methylation domain-containing protein
MHRSCNGCSGFTILELVIVMLISAILAVSFLPRFLTGPEFSAITAAEIVASDIRTVQAAAMFRGIPRSVIFDGTATYTAQGLSPETRVLPQGTTAEGYTITFNSFGEPSAGVGSFSVVNGSTEKHLSVTALTGKVTIL